MVPHRTFDHNRSWRPADRELDQRWADRADLPNNQSPDLLGTRHDLGQVQRKEESMNREVEQVTAEAFTTRQLVERLLSIDPGADKKGGDANILFICNYGDRSQTQQALPIAEADKLLTSDLDETAYSQSGICLREPQDEPLEDTCDGEFPVIVLQS